MFLTWGNLTVADRCSYFSGVFCLLCGLVCSGLARAESPGFVTLMINGAPVTVEIVQPSASGTAAPSGSVVEPEPLPANAKTSPEQKQTAAPQSALHQNNPVLNERLMESTRRGKLNEVQALLRQGADPNYTEASGASPAYLAVKTGWVELAEILHAGGANFTHSSDNGTSFLHIAAAAGQVRMAAYLVSIGCSPSVTTRKGWTPLHHAARFGKSDMVNFLLSAGASTNVRNSDGFSPLGLARNARQAHIVGQLAPYTSVSDRSSSSGSNKKLKKKQQ